MEVGDTEDEPEILEKLQITDEEQNGHLRSKLLDLSAETLGRLKSDVKGGKSSDRDAKRV